MKYCDQINAVVRNKTLAVTGNLSSITEDMDVSPEEVYSPYSRFVFTILDTDKGKKTGIKANIRVDEIPALIKRTTIAINKIVESEGIAIKEGQQESLAFTEKLRFGVHKGKSPGEVLSKDASQKDSLLFTKKSLEENLAKYSTNANLISSIDEAIALCESGKLNNQSNNASTGIIKIHESGERYFTSEKEKDANGNHKIYKISILCDPSKNYPFAVNIMNCYAPVEVKPNGTTQIKMSASKNVISFSISLNEVEWVNIVEKIQSKMRRFEQLNASNIDKQNEKLRWKPEAVNS